MWPKRLDWISIAGLRGWTGQRIDFHFPITAVVGENGAGKSTVLQCAASVYKEPPQFQRKYRFASDFFPDTPWDLVENAEVEYGVRQGSETITSSIRKPTSRWRRNPQRPERHVEYIDLSRIQPIPSRHGYSKLANPSLREVSAELFDREDLARLGQVMGREYGLARMAHLDETHLRPVPVLGYRDIPYSGFHGGAGETTISELIKVAIPDYSIVIIDEIETSLHPRTQRRLMRDLATICRQKQVQILLSTHSPYILDELPEQARAFIILGTDGERQMMYGVSPEFAMTKMDDVPQYECDLYVEDERAKTMLEEILVTKAPDLVQRVRIIPYGAKSVGMALGQMVEKNRFPTPSRVFLDGDVGEAPGCLNLPGEDAPERVVMGALKKAAWLGVASRTGRNYPHLADACTTAMTLADHHDWVRQAATDLVIGGDTLWQALSAEWAAKCLDPDVALRIAQSIQDAVDRVAEESRHPGSLTARLVDNTRGPTSDPSPSSSPPEPTGFGPLFEQ